MPTDFKRVIDDLNAVLAEANQIRSEVRQVPRVMTSRRWADPGDDEVRTYTAKNDEDIARANSLLLSALGKYAPRSSGHVENGRRVVEKYGLDNEVGRQQLIGIVRALLFEYERGSVKTIDEEVRGAVAGDYLEAARSLVEELKDAAALLASGVLEQQIREIAAKYGVPIREHDKPRKTEIINQDLTKAGAYPLDIQKQITAHLGLRNHAAHGHWKEYDAAQVKLMIDWIAFFVQKYPA